MPRRPYYQRKSPAPRPEVAPGGPTTATLLAQADALTRLARGTWITVILGCLYVWITLAALRDIQLFLPTESLTLPIINIGIAPDGFFVFAPLLLLAVFTHLHLTLIRLWRIYRDLGAPDGTVDGLPVLDRVSPWMLNHVMSQQNRGFEWLAKGSAYFFGWFFAPITIIALSYRYLRTHDPLMTDYHAIISALAITLATGFWLEKKQALSSFTNTANWAIAAIATVALALGLSRGATALIDARVNFPTGLDFFSTNAQLYRAELSQKPADWDSLRMTELSESIDDLTPQLGSGPIDLLPSH